MSEIMTMEDMPETLKAKLPPLSAIRYEMSRRSLRNFIQHAWHVVEPATDYVNGWHIDAICEHVTAVINGDIKNLLINIPPRHMKSLIVSVFMPAWVWINHPYKRFLFASYGDTLSIRDSVKCRRLIQSPWYQAGYGKQFILTSDQNQKTRFENNRTGYRLATSVHGVATGEGGDIICVDDPHNVLDGESVVKREGVLTWWDEVMSSRLNDPKRGGKIIVMQRVHERDLSGHVLEAGDYVHLRLPARYEPTTMVTSLGFKDPRTVDGEPLWPERYGDAELKQLERDLGSYAAAAQLQQRPAPREGGFIKREWLKVIECMPEGIDVRTLRWWDLAATAESKINDPDYTAGAKVGYDVKTKHVYVMHIAYGKLSPLDGERLIARTAEADTMSVPQHMEQEPGASGKYTIDHFQRGILAEYAFRGERITGSKESYIDRFAAAAEAGRVFVIAGEWNKLFIDQATVFPKGAHDDLIDAAAKGYCKLASDNLVKIRAA